MAGRVVVATGVQVMAMLVLRVLQTQAAVGAVDQTQLRNKVMVMLAVQAL